MRYGNLRDYLHPIATDDLIRLGRDCDGGYLVNASAVRGSDCLLSFGISDDWSFEEAFLATNDVPLLAFDGSIGTVLLLKRAFRSLVTSPRKILRQWRTLIDFLRFFRGERRFFPMMVGEAVESRSTSLGDLLARFVSGRFRRVFIKCDIEGCEYRILDDLVRNADLIRGLVIEFHDVDLMDDKIAAFVAKFPLAITHVHINNWAGLSPDGVPYVIEVSFARLKAGPSIPAALPHPLERANNPKAEEICLIFAG